MAKPSAASKKTAATVPPWMQPKPAAGAGKKAAAPAKKMPTKGKK